MLEIQPISLKEARAFVDAHHRHHRAPQGGMFAIAVNDGEEVVGVVIIGRPIARRNQDGYSAEVTRLCVLEGNPNACSMLYAAAWRAAKAMGYRKVITYILDTEPGTSLKAAGWRIVGQVKGKSWNVPSRKRVDNHPLQDKLKWEMS